MLAARCREQQTQELGPGGLGVLVPTEEGWRNGSRTGPYYVARPR
ncbi:hypothetical protein ACIRBX_18340 [Kitasatospora sp. NPDC096147]